MKQHIAPRARQDGLVVRVLEDEVLVYELDEHKAHCLNDTAARVWKRCDGKSTAADIARSLAEELGEPVDEGVVWLALGELWKLHLLEGEEQPAENGISRKQFVRKAGLAAAVTLPVVSSLAVPSAAMAVTGVPCGQPCTVGGIPCAAPCNACVNNVCVQAL